MVVTTIVHLTTPLSEPHAARDLDIAALVFQIEPPYLQL